MEPLGAVREMMMITHLRPKDSVVPSRAQPSVQQLYSAVVAPPTPQSSASSCASARSACIAAARACEAMSSQECTTVARGLCVRACDRACVRVDAA